MRREVVLAYPGDLDTPTGGYAYDRRMTAELRAAGWKVTLLSLPDRFPFPEAGDLAATDAALAVIGDDALVLVDGLAFGAMPTVVEKHAGRLRLVALVHHPLALEAGLTPAQSEAMAEAERRALRFARRVVATSDFTARQLEADYGVNRQALTVANPGTDRGPPAIGGGQPPRILAVGSLTPRKGYDLLLTALEGLAAVPWRCLIVGALDRSPETASTFLARAAESPVGDRIQIAGAIVTVRKEMATADVFVSASLHEGYGMAFAEAMSQGLPVVGFAAGAVPDLVPPDAGLLVPAGDVEALREALRSVLNDAPLRRRLAEGARKAGAALPTWSETARVLEAALVAAAS